VLGYGCQYQGGYLFSINDTTPTTESIGGKVVATSDQAEAYPNGIAWSPGGVFDSIWGIDDTSASSAPKPDASQGATFKMGQLNCDAVNDGACATHNIVVFYTSSTSYAAGLCRQPLTGSSDDCSEAACYTDWYLPSNCDLGPFGSTGTTGGSYYSFTLSKTCISGSTNIQQQLVEGAGISLAGFYSSSTEYSEPPSDSAWVQNFDSSGGFQDDSPKSNANGVRCVRDLTN